MYESSLGRVPMSGLKEAPTRYTLATLRNDNITPERIKLEK